jgi:hypothetical protein
MILFNAWKQKKNNSEQRLLGHPVYIYYARIDAEKKINKIKRYT